MYQLARVASPQSNETAAPVTCDEVGVAKSTEADAHEKYNDSIHTLRSALGYKTISLENQIAGQTMPSNGRLLEANMGLDMIGLLVHQPTLRCC